MFASMLFGEAEAAGFVDAADLLFPRSGHTATALPSGKVLVAGASSLEKRAELYDPATETWSQAGAFAWGRYAHTATLLQSGKVLVAGGYGNPGYLAFADIYDPASNSWSSAAAMQTPRHYHTATLLPSGKVLVAGGFGTSLQLASAEIYDPASNSWSFARAMPTRRSAHAAILLDSGKVLVCGGVNGTLIDSTEIYDPETNTWTLAGPLQSGRAGHALVLLASGEVLALGGTSAGVPISSAERFDPTVGTWRPASPMSIPRSNMTATLLESGDVLVIAGRQDSGGGTTAAEMYEPEIDGWRPAGNLASARGNHAAVRLHDGRVLVTGGFSSGSGVVANSEMFDPRTSMSIATDLPVTVVGQTFSVNVAVLAPSGTATGSVMIADGMGGGCGPLVLADGSASCSFAPGLAGSLDLTATYSPDTAAFLPSSAAATHWVVPASTSLSISDHSPDPSIPGQAVTIALSLAVDAPGAGSPDGPVSVSDGIDSCVVETGATTCDLHLTTRGPRMLTATYEGDGNFNGSTVQVPHAVNHLPIPSIDTYASIEDSRMDIAAGQGVLAGARDPDDDVLEIANAGTIPAAGIGGTIVLRVDGSFDYTPPADANGVATFEYVVSDGLEEVASTARIVVAAANDAPTFVLASVPAWPAGESGAKQQPGFARVAAFGPPDEAGQHVQAWSVRTITDPAGVASSVAISNDGTLSYTLSGNAGSATFGVTLQDDGGTANGGDDTSDEQVFTILVAAGLDLSVAIDDDRDFAQGGGTVEYTIVVHNAGPNAAVGARVRSLLPFNLVEPVWACTPDAGASCTAEGVGGIDDSVTIPMGASLIYVLGATVLADPEAPIESSASVLAPDGVPDADGANNSATDVDAVGIFADGFGGGDATLH